MEGQAPAQHVPQTERWSAQRNLIMAAQSLALNTRLIDY